MRSLLIVASYCFAIFLNIGIFINIGHAQTSCINIQLMTAAHPMVLVDGECKEGLTNVVDLDLTPIFQCQLPVGTDPALEALICKTYLPQIIDDLVESETFLDAVFVGYRDDIPAEFRDTLTTIIISVRLESIDGPGSILAQSGPIVTTEFPLGGSPDWNFTVFGEIRLDIDDIVEVVQNDRLVSLCTHGALHSLGFPFSFTRVGLIGESDVFGTVSFLGVNGNGFGLTEFRNESGNPFATMVSLSQQDGGAHLNPFEPTFVRPVDLLQEVLTPNLPSRCTNAFMTRTLRGMFADNGFKIPGINAPGIIDIDGDGIDDEPLIISPDSAIRLGDINNSGGVDLLDVAPFVALVTDGIFACQADLNFDGQVDLEDVQPFVMLLTNQ